MCAAEPTSILVAEDDEDMRVLVTLLLEDDGHEIRAVTNGAEALSAVARRMPDLILLDMKMPVMNGWEFAATFRARYGHAAPILVMTAAEHPAKRALEVGAEGWLSKPFSRSELIDAVRAQLRRVAP